MRSRSPRARRHRAPGARRTASVAAPVAACVAASLAAGAAQAAAFPARIDLRAVDGTRVVSQPVITPGQPEPVLLPFTDDVDGDGRLDRLFRRAEIDFDRATCSTVYLAPSSITSMREFDDAALAGLVRFDGFGIGPEGTDGRGSRCLEASFFDVVDDLNGDGVAEIAAPVVNLDDRGFDYRIAFGTVVPGAVVDAATLDGRDGFTLVGARSLVPVGDLNGDGAVDLYVRASDGENDEDVLGRVIAGNPSDVRPVRDVLDYAGAEVLLEIASTARLGPDPAIGRALAGVADAVAVGDLDGDGIDDLLLVSRIGGYAAVVYGAQDLQRRVETVADLGPGLFPGTCAEAFCDFSAIGDADGDGIDDVAVGSFETGGIVYGGPDGLPDVERIEDVPDARITRTEGSLGTLDTVLGGLSRGGELGDLNGDGAADAFFGDGAYIGVRLGTPGRRPATFDPGALDGRDGFTLVTGDRFFFGPLFASGDVDGDGLDDIVFGDTVLFGQLEFGAPPAPRDLVVRVGPDDIDLLWMAPAESEGLLGYRVFVDGLPVEDLLADVRAYRLEGVEADPARTVSVKALSVEGTVSPRVTERLGDGTDPIAGLRAEVYGPGVIELFWDAEPGRFVLLRDGEPLTTVNGNSYVDGTLEPRRDYRYAVVPDYAADGFFGEDVPVVQYRPVQVRSAVVTVRTGAAGDDPGGPGEGDPADGAVAPSVPGNLRGVAYSGTAAEIFWDRSRDDGRVIGYEVFRGSEPLGITDGNSRFDEGLTPGLTYTYQVVAIDDDGNRSELTAVNLVAEPGATGVAPPVGVPGGPDESGALPAPVRPRIEIYSDTALELFWERPRDPRVTGYRASIDGAAVAETGGTSAFLDALPVGASARLEIVSLGEGGVASAPVAFAVDLGARTARRTDGGGAGAPATPAGLTGTTYSPTALELFWERVPGATSYEVLSGETTLATVDGPSWFTDRAVPGAGVAYRVVAIDARGRRSAATPAVELATPRG